MDFMSANSITTLNTRLPGLEVALDIERMTANLGRLLASLPCSGGALVVTHATLLDHKPGKRGLIRFDVASAQQGGCRVVFGKLFSELSQAMQVYKAMCLLQAEVFSAETRYGVPQPLGCLPDPPLLIYLPAEGQFLDEIIASDQALREMRQVGIWLALLHRHRLPLEKQFDLARELVKLQEWVAVIGGRYAEEAETAWHILRHLEARAHDLEFEMDVPIHKDFHCGHVVVNEGIQVVDFDEMRLGDPNFDLAHFSANLCLLTRRRNVAAPFSTLQTEFLDAYARETGWKRDGRFAYFFAYTCLKIAWQLCSRKGPHSSLSGGALRRQIRWILNQGRAALFPETGAGGEG